MVNKYYFESVADLWKKDKKQYVKISTYSAYCLLVDNHLIPEFNGKEDITEELVQSYVLKELNKGLNEKTIKDILIVLKMILKFGVKNGMLEYRQIDIKFPTNHDKKMVEVLTRDHQRKLMDYLNDNFTFKNLGIVICLSTGLRIGELCALRWQDIDTEESIIKVRHTIQRIYITDEGDRKYTKILIDTPKTKESIRDIPLSTNLSKILKPLKKVVKDEYFVLTNDINPTEPRTYRNYYKRLLNKLGIPNIKFHGLRHSFATRCIEINSDYKTVSVILGHSNISTTLNLYVHPNKEQKKKCIDKMLKSL